MTVSVAELEVTEHAVAVMVVVPTDRSVVCPLLPAWLLIVATPVADDCQVTCVVMSWPLVPVALKLGVGFAARAADAVVGVIDIVDVLVPQTVMLDVPGVTDPDAAEMVADPTDCPVTTPPVLTEATALLLDVQVTVTGPVLPSLKVPVAVKVTVHTEPAAGGGEHGAIEAVAGTTEIAVNVGSMKNPLQPASSNPNMARATHTRLDRLRLDIPASEKES